MNIAVDIGNTCLKFGVFSPEQADEMVGFWRLPTDDTGWINERFVRNMTCEVFLTFKTGSLSKKKKEGAADTYPEPLHWRVAPTGNFPWQKLKKEILALRPKDTFKTITRKKIPLKVDVDSPEKVGLDRLLAAFAAVKKYGDAPMLVVDMGTAITADVVRNQTFCGGAIFPGLDALADTYPRISAKLPRIPYDAALSVGLDFPAGNTKGAVFSGIYWGTVGAIRQFYTMCSDRHETLLILTGGNAKIFLSGLSPMIPAERIRHHEALVLEGINLCTDAVR
jgi:type III pantothenate kinase